VLHPCKRNPQGWVAAHAKPRVGQGLAANTIRGSGLPAAAAMRYVSAVANPQQREDRADDHHADDAHADRDPSRGSVAQALTAGDHHPAG
jgi:hypothetical protein